jgi:hypothetical protein
MGNAVRRSTKQVFRDVDSSLFPEAEYIRDAVLPLVDEKYWKWTGDVPSEMTQAEKDQVDLSEQIALVDAFLNATAEAGKKSIMDWVVYNGIQNWTEAQKADILFNTPISRAMQACDHGAFQTAKYIVTNNVVAAAPLTQGMIDDFKNRMDSLSAQYPM